MYFGIWVKNKTGWFGLPFSLIALGVVISAALAICTYFIGS